VTRSTDLTDDGRLAWANKASVLPSTHILNGCLMVVHFFQCHLKPTCCCHKHLVYGRDLVRGLVRGISYKSAAMRRDSSDRTPLRCHRQATALGSYCLLLAFLFFGTATASDNAMDLERGQDGGCGDDQCKCRVYWLAALVASSPKPFGAHAILVDWSCLHAVHAWQVMSRRVWGLPQHIRRPFRRLLGVEQNNYMQVQHFWIWQQV
jgi:hypothetical protein